MSFPSKAPLNMVFNTILSHMINCNQFIVNSKMFIIMTVLVWYIIYLKILFWIKEHTCIFFTLKRKRKHVLSWSSSLRQDTWPKGNLTHREFVSESLYYKLLRSWIENLCRYFSKKSCNVEFLSDYGISCKLQFLDRFRLLFWY